MFYIREWLGVIFSRQSSGSAEAADASRLFFDMWAAKEALVKHPERGFCVMNEVELPLEAGVVPDEAEEIGICGAWRQGQCMRVRAVITYLRAAVL